MRSEKLLVLHVKTMIRDSPLVVFIVAFLLWMFIKNEEVSTFLETDEMFQFYSLFAAMLVGYAVTVSISFASFIKRKTSKFYHLYLLFPENPSKFLFIELLPILALSIVTAWGVCIILYTKAQSPSPQWLFLPLMGSLMFAWGIGTISISLVLQVTNVRVINAVMFFLIIGLSKIPRYVIEAGFSLEIATDMLVFISIITAGVGLLLMAKICPEKVVLSS